MKSLRRLLLLFCMSIILISTSVSTAFAADISGTEFLTGCDLSPGENKTVTLFIQNDDNTAHIYSLSAENSSNSYEFYFSSDGTAIKNVTVPANTSSQIDLNISLDGKASANQDKLSVKAVRDDGNENIINLSININNDYALSLKSMLDKVDVISGKSAEFTFSVTNNGYKDLNNIKITPELPYKWLASQNDESAITLKPGETGTFTIKVDVPNSQAAGNFDAKFIATSDEISSSQISIPVTVKTSSNIGLWMIGILLLIAVFTLVQFRRNGRR